MVNRFILGGLLIIAAGCGDDAEDLAAKSDASVTGGGRGGSTSSSGGSSGSNSSSSGSSGSSGASSSTGGSSASGAGGGSSDPGTAPTDGSQLARCEDDDDCGDGLNCYEFGGYCSAACATDADCSSLGASYTCNARGGMQGGGFPGGGGMQMGGDAAAPEPTGTCRIQCTGEMDTSCPSGMTCQSAGGGFMGGGGPGGGQMGGDGGTNTGSFRCAYEPAEEEPQTPPDGGMGMDMPGSGSSGAFQQCEDDDECTDGLECTGGGRGGSGYCSQSCEEDTDCAMQPGSGSAELTCGGGGACSLSCADDSQTCPDGMTCIRGGGGGGGFAFCGFEGGNGPGGNGPGGGGP